MTSSGPNLLIIGASTRAAAYSALRAGLNPLCLDMFADVDVKTHAVVQKIDDYPAGLIDALKALPRMPLLYVGGLENQPKVLQAAEEFHELVGNSAEKVAAARNPELLSEVMRMAQVEFPEWRPADDPPPSDGTWIVRPIFGSGGNGIAIWDEHAATSAVLSEPHLFQKRIIGTSYSGLYIASGEVGDIRFVGVTEQLIGESASKAREFQWCGNIGPATLSVPIEHKLRRVGNVLKWKAGLKGAFGVDYIITEDERIFATEVNPRYPASFELLEFATGQPLLHHHLASFGDYETSTAWTTSSAGPLWGKAVFYAPRDFILTENLAAHGCNFSEFPSIADIPEVGTSFKATEPVCTLFAQAESLRQCHEALDRQLRDLCQLITPEQ